MTNEYKKLLHFVELENSMHPLDEKRYKDFLNFSKTSGEQEMSITTFRSAFEEVWGKITEEFQEKKIDKLYKRYKNIK